MARIGVDIGGTFTDLCLVTDDGHCWTTKLLTTPADPSAGFMQILQRCFNAMPQARELREVVHATTVATNAILENKIARLGLLTTRGFRDVLEIGRHSRRDLYNLFLQRPATLVPRDRRLEIDERIDSRGQIVTPLNRRQAWQTIDQLLQFNVDVILVCFLNSYVNPAHERLVAEWVAERRDITVITSHELCREYREYERFSTAAVHGAILPRVRHYVRNIESGLRDHKINALFSVMQSNGGMCSASVVMRQPGLIVESGPAAGVIAVAEIGRRLGLSDLISFDMGGTTAKATIIRNGRINISHDYEVGGGMQGGSGTGYPLRVPVIDLVEIGTGGGSISSVDDIRQLHVGPRSAGAHPGPACYGQGGTAPTITDADLILGRLRADHFAGGELHLDYKAAEDAIWRCIAEPLGMTLVQAAEGIVAVANAQMVQALRLVSVQRGFDPRQFSLVAFGGAGPMHVMELARELGCPRIVIPLEAGVQSAWGLLVADSRRDFSHAIAQPVEPKNLGSLQNVYSEMVRLGRSQLKQAGFADSAMRDHLSVDARYVGQAYELTVELPDPPTFSQDMMDKINSLFHAFHQQIYNHSNPHAAVQWVTVRASIIGDVPRPAPRFVPKIDRPLNDRCMGRQKMIWAGRKYDAPMYLRSDLGQADRMLGPALIIQDDSSIALPPDVELTVCPSGELSIEIGGMK